MFYWSYVYAYANASRSHFSARYVSASGATPKIQKKFIELHHFHMYFGRVVDAVPNRIFACFSHFHTNKFIHYVVGRTHDSAFKCWLWEIIIKKNTTMDVARDHDKCFCSMSASWHRRTRHCLSHAWCSNRIVIAIFSCSISVSFPFSSIRTKRYISPPFRQRP